MTMEQRLYAELEKVTQLLTDIDDEMRTLGKISNHVWGRLVTQLLFCGIVLGAADALKEWRQQLADDFMASLPDEQDDE